MILNQRIRWNYEKKRTVKNKMKEAVAAIRGWKFTN
jgi:hypothetical protein